MEAQPDQRARLPAGVEAFQISGPLFFAVANRLDEVLDLVPAPPSGFILRMRLVPLIDASGVAALRDFTERCAHIGTRVVLSGLQAQPQQIPGEMGLRADGAGLHWVANFDEALVLARGLVADAVA